MNDLHDGVPTELQLDGRDRTYRRALPYIGAILCAAALALSPAAVVADSASAASSGSAQPQGPSAGRDPSGALQFTDPGNHADDSMYLQGCWTETAGHQGMSSGGGGAYLALDYEAIQVVGVIKPENGGSQRVDVTQDGKPISHDDAGKDIQFDGNNSYITVDAPRAYDIVMNKHYAKHELKFTPQRYGVGFYSFDFESCEVGSDK